MARACLLLGVILAPAAQAWTTIQQTSYGAQYTEIARQLAGACGSSSVSDRIHAPKAFFINDDINKTITVDEKWGTYYITVDDAPRSWNAMPPSPIGASITQADEGKPIEIVDGVVTIDGVQRDVAWPHYPEGKATPPEVAPSTPPATILSVEMESVSTASVASGLRPKVGGQVVISNTEKVGDQFYNLYFSNPAKGDQQSMVVTPPTGEMLSFPFTTKITSVNEQQDQAVELESGHTLTNPYCYKGDMRLKNMGHLWHWPVHVDDKTGLGGGLAWAWDPELCDALLPRFKENIAFLTLVDCAQLRLAMQRAMSSWSKNHRMINFLEVTDQCETEKIELERTDLITYEAEMLQYQKDDIQYKIDVVDGVAATAPTKPTLPTRLLQDCSLIELFVTAAAPDTMSTAVSRSSGDMTSSGTPVGMAEMSSDFNTNLIASGKRPEGHVFRLTNGEYFDEYPNTVEVVFAKISFGTSDDLCWYLDSMFCSTFHEWKKDLSSDMVETIIMACCFSSFALAFVSLLYRLRNIMYMLLCHNRLDVMLGLSEREAHWDDVSHEVVQWNSALVTLQILMISLPPLFYYEIFAPCFDCFDFEGAAVHEIGHALGIGHPNTAREEMPTSIYDPVAQVYMPGDNVYNSLLSAGTRLSGSAGKDFATQQSGTGHPTGTCANPWLYVRNNTPADATIDASACKRLNGNSIPSCVGIRDSVMEAFTQANPNVCLSYDDLEALHTMYPDCQFSSIVADCTQVNLFIGVTRMAIFIFVPLLIVLAFTKLLQSYILWYREKEIVKAEEEIEKTAELNVLNQFRIAGMQTQMRESQAQEQALRKGPAKGSKAAKTAARAAAKSKHAKFSSTRARDVEGGSSMGSSSPTLGRGRSTAKALTKGSNKTMMTPNYEQPTLRALPSGLPPGCGSSGPQPGASRI